jgi:hypothetical protein
MVYTYSHAQLGHFRTGLRKKLEILTKREKQSERKLLFHINIYSGDINVI